MRRQVNAPLTPEKDTSACHPGSCGPCKDDIVAITKASKLQILRTRGSVEVGSFGRVTCGKRCSPHIPDIFS